MLKELNHKEFGRIQRQVQETNKVFAQIAILFDALETRQEIKTGELLVLMVLYKSLTESLKDAKAGAQNMLDGFSINVVPDRLEEEELSSLAGENHRLEVRNQLRVSVPKEKKTDLHEWLKSNNLSDMIAATINASKLKGMVKEAMDAGTEFPAHLLKVDAFKQAVVVKK